MSTEEKACSDCKTMQPLTAYSKGKYGQHIHICKVCLGKRNQESKERRKREWEEFELRREEKKRQEEEKRQQIQLALEQRQKRTLALEQGEIPIEPCGEHASYWCDDFHDKIDYPDDTPHSGKWLIFCTCNRIDEIWTNVKQALHDGKLGVSVKVSVNKSKNQEHVICVYTYDYTDKQDVMRVRQSLRDIGVVWPIGYKADEATRQGIYSQHAAHGTYPPYARKVSRVCIYWQ